MEFNEQFETPPVKDPFDNNRFGRIVAFKRKVNIARTICRIVVERNQVLRKNSVSRRMILLEMTFQTLFLSGVKKVE